METASVIALIVGVLAALAAALNTYVVHVIAVRQETALKRARVQQAAQQRWRDYVEAGGEVAPMLALSWLRDVYKKKYIESAEADSKDWYARMRGPRENWDIDDIKANNCRKSLRMFWEHTVQMVKAGDLPSNFLNDGRHWFSWANSYRVEVEPIDIANYYARGLRGYMEVGRKERNPAYMYIESLAQQVLPNHRFVSSVSKVSAEELSAVSCASLEEMVLAK